MDNLTHGLLGVAIGMMRRRDGGPEHDRPLSDTDKAVMWATLLAAEVPDIDVFFSHPNPLVAEFTYHRGITHSVPGALLLAGLVAMGTRLVWRRARTGTVLAWSALSVLVAHLVNDWMTGWGTRLLLPFTERRYALDWVPIVDLLYTVPLLAAVLWGWRRPQVRRKAAAAVLGYLLLYTGARGVSQQLVARQVDAAYAGQPVAQRRVSPDLLVPWRWRYVVDLPDRYETGHATVLTGLAPAREVAKPPEDEVVAAVRRAPELAPFFAQFGYPLITYEQDADGFVVKLTDVRYQARAAGLTYQVRLAHDLSVVAIGGKRLP